MMSLNSKEKSEASSVITSTSKSIFEGLTFPKVPQSEVIIRSKTKYNSLKEEDDEIEMNDSSGHPLNSQIYETIAIVEDYESEENMIEMKQKFAKLYSTADSDIQISQERNVSYPDVPSPILSAKVSHNPTAPTDTQSNSSSFIHDGNNEEQLVNDLIAQNIQLNNEVNALKHQLNQIQPTSGVLNQGFGYEINSPAQGILSDIGPSEIPQLRQDQRGRVKYICCGRCRSWFLTAKDVIYVSCPQCTSINNCNLVQRPQQVGASDTRAFTMSK